MKLNIFEPTGNRLCKQMQSGCSLCRQSLRQFERGKRAFARLRNGAFTSMQMVQCVDQLFQRRAHAAFW